MFDAHPTKKPKAVQWFLALTILSILIFWGKMEVLQNSVFTQLLNNKNDFSYILYTLIGGYGLQFFIWAMVYTGRNWARYLLLFLIVVTLPKDIFLIANAYANTPYYSAIDVLIIILKLCSMACLFTPTANAWFNKPIPPRNKLEKISLLVFISILIFLTSLGVIVQFQNIQKSYSIQKTLARMEAEKSIDVCNIDNAKKKASQSVKIAYEKNIAEAIKQIDYLKKIMTDNSIAPEKFDEYIEGVTAYSLLIAQNCTIPEDLEHIYNIVSFGEDDPAIQNGAVDCTPDAYSTEAQNQLTEMKAQDDYAEVEPMFRESLKYGEDTPELTNRVINDLWEEQEFRDMVIRLSLQSQYREENQCKNPYLPFTALTTRITKHMLSHPEKYTPK